MFPHKKRFPRALFPLALATGRRFSSPHFTVIVPKRGILPVGEQGYAVVVPKKIARLSVTRHRMKRQILEVLHTLRLPPACIVFSRSSLNGVHYPDIEKELTNLFSDIKN